MIEEFYAINGNKKRNTGKRVIDGIIVPGEKKARQSGGSFDFKGKDIIVIQTKANRLGMTLMGQAYFSREIMKRYKPKSIKTVAICGKSDSKMEDLCNKAGIEVVVIPDKV